MTTLKSFQAEIEQISNEKHKLAIKEVRETHAAAELVKHHGKLNGKKEVENNGDAVTENGHDEVKEVAIEVSVLGRALTYKAGHYCV